MIPEWAIRVVRRSGQRGRPHARSRKARRAAPRKHCPFMLNARERAMRAQISGATAGCCSSGRTMSGGPDVGSAAYFLSCSSKRSLMK